MTIKNKPEEEVICLHLEIWISLVFVIIGIYGFSVNHWNFDLFSSIFTLTGLGGLAFF